ncbi:MAG TPA: NAD(P)-dependent oxidoreductase [Burkholderiales bacterium]
MKIGIAGTGRMGAAIAQRCLNLGHEVTVWNRTAARTQPLAAAGAKVAATPFQAASFSETVITILTDAAAIDTAYHATDGLLSGKVAGKLFIEMSTVRPETERDLSARIREKGATMVECPVGGTVGPAKDGKLFGFVGGEAADVARAKPLLEQLCRRVEHVGPVGAGASMKLAINLPLLVFWQAFGEALSLCDSLGLDAARLIDIFADTSGGPNVLKNRGPALTAALQGKDVDPITVDIDAMRKDLRTMIEEAQSLGTTLPVTASALQCYDEASQDGLGKGDITAIPVRWMKLRKDSSVRGS